MTRLARIIGEFIAPIIEPIVMRALEKFFSDTATVSKANDRLESIWEQLDGESKSKAD